MATPTKPATTLLILGAGGELTHRLLLPGIATLLMAEQDRTLRIVGSDRVEMTPAEWKARIKDSFATVQAPQTVTRAASKDTAYIKADYYDTAGALRDMIQSHLIQVLAIFALESIATLDAQELQDQKAQVMRAMRLWGGEPQTAARRARYTKGSIGGRKIPDYIKEPGVDPKRLTETLAEMTIEVANNRWSGVPFILRSGKALGRMRKEIVVTFRDVAHMPHGFAGPSGSDMLVIGLKPGTVSLIMTMNAEGDPLDLEQKALEATLAPPRMQAYGEVLGQILDGSQLLTVRGDSAEECWRIVEPVLKAFSDSTIPMETYAAGSLGPRDWATSRERY